jgi:hypothetical protein
MTTRASDEGECAYGGAPADCTPTRPEGEISGLPDQAAG